MVNILGFTATCISILFWVQLVNIAVYNYRQPFSWLKLQFEYSFIILGLISTFLSIGWFIYG